MTLGTRFIPRCEYRGGIDAYRRTLREYTTIMLELCVIILLVCVAGPRNKCSRKTHIARLLQPTIHGYASRAPDNSEQYSAKLLHYKQLLFLKVFDSWVGCKVRMRDQDAAERTKPAAPFVRKATGPIGDCAHLKRLD